MTSYIPIPTPIVMPTHTGGGGASLPIWEAWVLGIIYLLLTVALSSILGWVAGYLWEGDLKFFSILCWVISVVSFAGLSVSIITGIIIPAYG